MASVPLLCNICPKQPDFSDLSHLLTHIASKGHLSHYFKAQVRGRQDHDVRQKVEEYDRWYVLHDIERHLSQRMSSKDAKRANKTSTPVKRDSKGQARQRKKPPKDSATPEPQESPFKDEMSIDPILVDSLLSPATSSKQPDGSSGQHAIQTHRAFVPHMSDLQDMRHLDDQNPYSAATFGGDYKLNTPDACKDEAQDYFRDFLGSPSCTLYPDPSELEAKTAVDTSKNEKVHQRRPRRKIVAETKRTRLEDSSMINQSPMLKGTKWPGMSIFDSASDEAQRLRNQKKDGSIVEQMELNSVAVEPIESIYWPEGALKKSRVITGNVESSPISETTPLPPRRRLNPVRSRTVLADLDPNQPTVLKRRPRKPRPALEAMEKDLDGADDLMEKAKIRKRTAYNNNEDVNETCRHSTSHRSVKRRPFEVFKDENTDLHLKESEKEIQSTLSQVGGKSPSISAPSTQPAMHGLPFEGLEPPRSWYHQLQLAVSQLSHGLPTTAVDTPSLSHQRSSADPDSGSAQPSERVTQRYFTITEGEEPQFFDSLPPQMDFGGLAGPKYRGSTLNPLNPKFRPKQPHWPNDFASVPQGYPSDHVDPSKVYRNETFSQSKHQPPPKKSFSKGDLEM